MDDEQRRRTKLSYDRRNSIPSRPGRDTLPGRRKTDMDPRTTLSRKALVAVVFIINFLYLLGEALIFKQDHCL